MRALLVGILNFAHAWILIAIFGQPIRKPGCQIVAITLVSCTYTLQLSGADMECEVKPLSNEEEEEGEEPVAREEEPEDEPHLKEKKPSDSDDDDEEPPPPYTPHDPQEEKSDDDSKKTQGASGEGCEESGAVGEGAIPIGQLSDLPSELAARSDQDGGSSLLSDHPKLIPEPSLGFQVQAPSDSTVHQQSEGLDAARVVEKPASNSTSDSESDASSRPATTSPLSPAELSRISSPEKGRTLSEMTRITPEDEARVVETQLTSSIPGDSRTASSDSNTTLVNSQSQQSQSELTVAESSTTVTTSSSEQSNSQSNSQPVASSPVPPSGGGSSGGGGLKSFLKGKGKGRKPKSSGLEPKSKEKAHRKGKHKDSESSHTPNSPSQSSTGKKGKEKVKDAAPSERNSTPQSPQGNLKVSSYAAQGLGNSQESFVDGLSPELSDYGDHSNEVPDYLPREARILRAGYVIGLSIDLDDKNCVVVKSVSSSGAVGRDGRIRVGDRIEAINGKALAGVTLNRAKGILKRASKSDEICVTYSPAPGPTAAQFSPTLPPSTATQEKQLPRKAASMPGKVGSAPKQHNPYYPIATMASQLHDQQESAVPGPQASGGMPMQSLPPQVQGLPTHLMQQPGSVPQWPMEGVSPYHSGSMHHLPPQLQGFYGQRSREGNPPPPPYLFHHQGPSVRAAPTIMAGQPAYAGHTPSQMSWSLQQQQMAAPQGIVIQFVLKPHPLLAICYTQTFWVQP